METEEEEVKRALDDIFASKDIIFIIASYQNGRMLFAIKAIKHIIYAAKQKNHQGRSLPLPRFPRFYLGKTTEGTGRGGNLTGQGLGDAVSPGSQGIRGSPSPFVIEIRNDALLELS